MPFAIHPEAARKQMNWNVRATQEVVPDPLPENWQGTSSGGLPVKQIPHLEFPRVMYLHPNEPFEEIEHRNDKFEVVSTDVVPTEHLTKIVNSEEDMQTAMVEGWLKEPYVPKPAPARTVGLYGPKKAKAR